MYTYYLNAMDAIHKVGGLLNTPCLDLKRQGHLTPALVEPHQPWAQVVPWRVLQGYPMSELHHTVAPLCGSTALLCVSARHRLVSIL